MSGPPIPMEAIEEEANIRLTEEPLFDIQDGVMPVRGLLEELDVLEEAAEQQFNEETITRETRLGILIAVAGLRDSVRQASDGFIEVSEPRGGESDG